MMEDLKTIEMLRVYRERSALFALRNANTSREDAAKTASIFKEYLQTQREAQLASEQRLYKETLGKALSPPELEAVQARVHRENAEIGALARQASDLDTSAAHAASAAEQALLRHTHLLKMQKKWERVQEHYAEKLAIEEMSREELAHDALEIRKSGI
jgi:hypothetical protein